MCNISTPIARGVAGSTVFVSHVKEKTENRQIDTCSHTHLASFPHHNLVGGRREAAPILNLRNEDGRVAS